eukprot:Lithocolla_globosa_v1_NODE_4897_length_1343_cov_98.801242.p1 type:complete len:175 gc:universal NODE_4897_length_1343_cov_98.801242:1039-515(-)
MSDILTECLKIKTYLEHNGVYAACLPANVLLNEIFQNELALVNGFYSLKDTPNEYVSHTFNVHRKTGKVYDASPIHPLMVSKVSGNRFYHKKLHVQYDNVIYSDDGTMETYNQRITLSRIAKAKKYDEFWEEVFKLIDDDSMLSDAYLSCRYFSKITNKGSPRVEGLERLVYSS